MIKRTFVRYTKITACQGFADSRSAEPLLGAILLARNAAERGLGASKAVEGYQGHHGHPAPLGCPQFW